MNDKIKIRPYHPFNRWVLLNANDLSLGWSGSRWVPLFGPVQVSNFGTSGEAKMYAEQFGFEVVDETQFQNENNNET